MISRTMTSLALSAATSRLLGRLGPTVPRRGLAATELALVLPFLTFMMVVTVDYCRLFYVTQTLWNCANVAAVYASQTAQCGSATTPTNAAIQAGVNEGSSLNPALEAADVQVDIGQATVTVTVQYNFTTLTSWFSSSNTVSLSRTVTMNVAPAVGG
ncbi:MAG TPA: TadE/TadG family type IV pilus assembly protein [Gemmataceae bacterium]|nr:TadE/TadG family type IV pilus assembly protein [Gemmataceae bacterium]